MVRTKPLSETEAIEVGADFIAECMVWSAASLQVIVVYWYSDKDKANKHKEKLNYLKNIQLSFDNLKNDIQKLENEIQIINSYLAVHSMDDSPTTTTNNNDIIEDNTK